MPGLRPSWAPIQSSGRPRTVARRYLVDLCLLLVAFLATHCLKKKKLAIDLTYLQLMLVYIVAWASVSLACDKFRRLDQERRQSHKLAPFVTSCLYMAGLISLFLYVADLFDLSRFIIYGALSLYLLLEILFLSGDYLPFFSEGVSRRERLLSFAFFGLELSSLAALYTLAYINQFGLNGEEHPSAIPFFYVYFIWLLAGLLIHHFRLEWQSSCLKMIYPHVKSLAVVLCCSVAVLYIFKLTGSSPRRYLLPLFVVAVLELAFVTLYYVFGKPGEKLGSIFRVPELAEAAKVDVLVTQHMAAFAGPVRFEKRDSASPQFAEKMKHIYLKDCPEIMAFVQRTVDIESVDIVRAEVLDSSNPYNVEVMPDGTMEFFMNRHRLNTQRDLNRYLREVHRKLVPGGVFLGNFQPCELRRLHYVQHYPRAVANFLYFLDFIWFRLLPKIILLRRVRQLFPPGRTRVFSLAEGFGRLSYCGFSIVGIEFHDSAVHFCARRTGEPELGRQPASGLLFKMQRTGKGGKLIYVYKIRTMHPYSEYLQGYVTSLFGYGELGKVKEDIRVTAWGRFLRRFWLDEIPQVVNLLKGDMALVGVRPLSNRFLANYPEWLRAERQKRKPGCIPPYVAYRTQRVEEYIDSEIRYLQEKKAHPILTDIRVLFWGLYNILFNRIRSE